MIFDPGRTGPSGKIDLFIGSHEDNSEDNSDAYLHLDLLSGIVVGIQHSNE